MRFEDSGLSATEVTVTAEDIALGVPLDADRCAVARAVRRAAHDYEVYVTKALITQIDTRTASRNLRYYTSPGVAQRIADFDAHLFVKPFTFWLDGDRATMRRPRP